MIAAIRAIGLLEGLSSLILYFVAMPMKYLWQSISKENFFAIGMGHGVLFTVYAVIVTIAVIMGRLPGRWWVYLAIASIVPFGPFVADRRLKSRQPSPTSSNSLQ
jgi:integral membrane protein